MTHTLCLKLAPALTLGENETFSSFFRDARAPSVYRASSQELKGFLTQNFVNFIRLFDNLVSI